MARTYLDHASTTPLRKSAADAMSNWIQRSRSGSVGDPSRSHSEGLASRAELEEARAAVAALFGARPREVMFCSGATEAIATAAHGATHGRHGDHSVITAVEHAAVRAVASRGESTTVTVDAHGRVDTRELLGAISDTTAIVHLQWANHEVGTLQPVAEVVAACRERGVMIHIDAAQAAGRLPISFSDLGADLMSISGHKLGGPPGTGVLLVRRGLRLDPMLVGGDQERARRAGMENLLGAIGLGAAAVELARTLADEQAAALELTRRLISWVDATPGLTVLGHPTERAPHIVCLAVDGVEPQAVLIGLDRVGIAVHSGNSCSSEALEPSPVLLAMGADAAHSLRVSVGWSTTEHDIDRLIAELPPILEGLRSLRG